jgi:hypothetical protein
LRLWPLVLLLAGCAAREDCGADVAQQPTACLLGHCLVLSIARDENRPGLYREYPQDFFDLIIVDECHRGSARDDSNWREILDYFQPAIQLGMTATPRRQDITVDTDSTATWAAASLQAPTLFTIANDLSKMVVHTNVDEADVGNIREGQEVTFTVDAYPARRFRGKVYQVRNAPTVVQNVVTYAAVVRIDNNELILKPGKKTNVQFLVSRKEDVLTIPNMALRFRHPDDKSEAQDLLRREQSRAAPTLGAKRTSRAGTPGAIRTGA